MRVRASVALGLVVVGAAALGNEEVAVTDRDGLAERGRERLAKEIDGLAAGGGVVLGGDNGFELKELAELVHVVEVDADIVEDVEVAGFADHDPDGEGRGAEPFA